MHKSIVALIVIMAIAVASIPTNANARRIGYGWRSAGWMGPGVGLPPWGFFPSCGMRRTLAKDRRDHKEGECLCGAATYPGGAKPATHAPARALHHELAQAAPRAGQRPTRVARNPLLRVSSVR